MPCSHDDRAKKAVCKRWSRPYDIIWWLPEQKGWHFGFGKDWTKAECNTASWTEYCPSVRNARSSYEGLPKKQLELSPDGHCRDEGMDKGVNCPCG